MVTCCSTDRLRAEEGAVRPKRYRVELTDEERAELEGMLRKGRAAARRLARARILLSADENRLDQETAAAVRCTVGTVERIRRRFVEGGVVKARTASLPASLAVSSAPGPLRSTAATRAPSRT